MLKLECQFSLLTKWKRIFPSHVPFYHFSTAPHSSVSLELDIEFG